MKALQVKVGVMDRDRIRRSQHERTREKRLYIRYEWNRLQRRSLKVNSGETCFTFSSAFKRFPYEFSIDCTLHDFAAIAADISSHFERGVQYMPSLPTITAEALPFQQKHIVFEKCESLFKWIGVSDRERKSIEVQSMKRKSNCTLQILGGAHWDIYNNQRSLNFFPGRSSSRALPIVKTEQELPPVLSEDVSVINASVSTQGSAPAPCITLNSTEWDASNGCFKDEFHLASSSTFIEKITPASILDFDAFTLSWKPLKNLRSQDTTSTLSHEEPIVLGKMVLYIPAVVFIGDQLSKRVLTLVSNLVDVD